MHSSLCQTNRIKGFIDLRIFYILCLVFIYGSPFRQWTYYALSTLWRHTFSKHEIFNLEWKFAMKLWICATLRRIRRWSDSFRATVFVLVAWTFNGITEGGALVQTNLYCLFPGQHLLWFVIQDVQTVAQMA